ncbi:acetyltransferase (GNAT) family protein [Mumia flava]|uniref:Acetyltransferase (GNAT) family protein n=1 Tax=Mumia flava TaxID=1348852 RepID=A0A2M9BH47_9ACTN|nr:GNAT family N-acetyltransferase [Mumia flava]PJJ57259.1 acetyltransferase (GNAT) family protein [Mumia flava]
MIPAAAYRLDAASIVALRDDLARWQQREGIEQWQVGEVGADEVRDQIAAGQWSVLRDDGQIQATIRLMESDPFFWDDLVPGTATDALYVHGLMVRRAQAGRGLGEVLLDWAARRAADDGRAFLRLDARVSNPRLIAYYARLGFVERGARAMPEPWGEAMRLERPV